MQEPAMTPVRLDELLAEAGTEACALAREALAAGIPPDFRNGIHATQPTRSLFTRRERHGRRGGQGSVGFETALRALGAYPDASLAWATIDARPRDGYLFELFLTPDLARVIACFGVARPSRDGVRHPDAPPWSPLEEIVLRLVLERDEKVAKLAEIPDVPAGLVAGLEKYLAIRHWPSFGRYAELVRYFPSPEAAPYLAEALEAARLDPYAGDVLVATVKDALAACRPSTTSYVKVRWDHDFADDPVELFSELGEDRYEVRKVHVHRDGRADWADAGRETDTIGLGEVPFPPLAEISAQPEFHAEEITAAEFEAAWLRATSPATLSGSSPDAPVRRREARSDHWE